MGALKLHTEQNYTGLRVVYGGLYEERKSVQRFLNVDPLTKGYPFYTPYQFAGNLPIAAIDLDGLEQRIVIFWYDVEGNLTKTQLNKTDSYKIWSLLAKNGISKEISYTIEGVKFNADNAVFSGGFQDYSSGRATRAKDVRWAPAGGTLRFDIKPDAKGNNSVEISFIKADFEIKLADVLRGLGKIGQTGGKVVEGAGYATVAFPGGQKPGLIMITAGKIVDFCGDLCDMGADLLEDKNEDFWIKLGITVVDKATGIGIDNIPGQKKLVKEAIDTYVGTTTGVIKDGVVANISHDIEEIDKIEFKQEGSYPTSSGRTSKMRKHTKLKED
jgi:hypothetical protein